MDTRPARIQDEESALEWLTSQPDVAVETSMQDLAERWGWGKSKVNRRLKRWETDGRITVKQGPNRRSVITPVKSESPEKPAETVGETIIRTPAEPRSETPRLSCRNILRWTCCIVLGALAFWIAWCGLQINMWYGSTLGRTQEASSMFGYGSVAADLLALFLPTAASILWNSRQRIRALIACGILVITTTVAVNNTIGFAALNIADTTAARERVTTDRSMLTQRMGRLASDRYAALADIARGDHPTRAARRRDEIEKQMDDVERQLSSLPAVLVSDPQADAASALLKWVSYGSVNLSSESVRTARIAGMTTLFNVAGLVLMLAWGCGARSR